MTFKQSYEKEDNWWKRVLLMELFHLSQIAHNRKWRMEDTAKYFGQSKALVSENLKLAKLEDGLTFEYRKDAMAFLRSQNAKTT